MGRVFSTTYRVFLLIMAIAAVVLTYLSGTSCSFLSFDHQYASSTRFLEEKDGDDSDLQDQAKELLDTLIEEGTSPEDVADDIMTIEPTASTNLTPSTSIGTMIPTVSPIASPALKAAKVNLDEDDSDKDDLDKDNVDKDDLDESEYDEEGLDKGDLDEGDPVDSTTEPTEVLLSVSQSSPTPLPTTGSPVQKAPNKARPVQKTPNPSTGSPETPSPRPTLGNSVPEPSFSDVSSVAKTTDPDIVVTGEAGLFCDSQKNFDFKKQIWSGSIQKLEDEITLESENNQSEELARNAVIAAAVFGTIIAFIVILECVLGWRMCCERYIIGLIAMCAVICQGVTFLFFNSQQYCNGDIVHEIINQEPCVISSGGIDSAIAVSLYGLIMIMACRLPSDDPYGLCNKSSRQPAGSTELSQDDSGLNMDKRNRPWVSADEKKNAIDDENEII